MSENSFISIRNGAIASILAGIVLLIVPSLRGYVADFFGRLWLGVVWCWNALFSSYALPGWAWLGISVFAIIGLLNIYIAIRGETETPEYNSYVEDSFYGAKWRWVWIENRIAKLWCYCPICDATLVYDDSSCRSFRTNAQKTFFICENCGDRVVATITGGDKRYATGAVEREIHRRIRTGEYKKNH
jgi:uncharacterized protein YlaI